jgi:flavin reductase (DIM6/NTAB) family NADH-FMN oxidoreductase RutF
MKTKYPIEIQKSHRIINPGSLAIITTSFGDDSTIAPIAWAMPASNSPKLMAIAFNHNRYSLELLLQSHCFCINIADESILNDIMFCGKNTGRNVNKFKETSLTPVECNKIKTSYIDQCIAHIECSVRETSKAGDHTIVIAEVVDAYSDEDFLNDNDVVNLEKYSPIHHLGGNSFSSLKKI